MVMQAKNVIGRLQARWSCVISIVSDGSKNSFFFLILVFAGTMSRNKVFHALIYLESFKTFPSH